MKLYFSYNINKREHNDNNNPILFSSSLWDTNGSKNLIINILFPFLPSRSMGHEKDSCHYDNNHYQYYLHQEK